MPPDRVSQRGLLGAMTAALLTRISTGESACPTLETRSGRSALADKSADTAMERRPRYGGFPPRRRVILAQPPCDDRHIRSEVAQSQRGGPADAPASAGHHGAAPGKPGRDRHEPRQDRLDVGFHARQPSQRRGGNAASIPALREKCKPREAYCRPNMRGA